MTTYANPGAIADVVGTSGLIESTWGQAIRDRVVNNFASTAARDAAIPSLVIGQACVCIISGTPTFLIYQGATTGWTPPWNTAWGYITDVTVQSNQGSITTLTDVTSATVTWTAVAGRKYRITYSFRATNASLALCAVTITDGSNAIKNPGQLVTSATGGADYTWSYVESGLAAGSKTRKMRASAAAGSLTIAGAARDTTILVEDIGPSAAPA